MRLVLTAALAVLLAAGCRAGKGPGKDQDPGPVPPADRPRLVVIGMDGLDPDLLASLVAAGRVPNLERLHRMPLATTTPSDPATAWASLITGTSPSTHAVPGDFPLHPARSEILQGPWIISDDGSEVSTIRLGEPFWVTASRAGVRARVIAAPCSFPPDAVRLGEVLAGGDTPDLLARHGGYVSIPRSAGAGAGAGTGAASLIPGPVLGGEPTFAEVVLSLGASTGGDQGARSGQESVAITPHTWSDFLPLVFEAKGGDEVHGLTRFLVPPRTASAIAYAEAPHIDPFDPRWPVSSPRYYAGFLADRYGRYRISWDGADAEALDSGAMDTSDYLKQMWGSVEQEERMVLGEIGRGGWDLFVAVFAQPGDAVRMFSRVSDPALPSHDEALATAYGSTVEDLYVRLDRFVGEIMKVMRPEDRVLVLASRGVRPVAREVSLSAWLVQAGYTVLSKRARTSAREGFADVDWARTRAFGSGAGDIYINVKGMHPAGIVEPGDAEEALRAEIAGKLALLSDRGKPVVHEVVDGKGQFPGSAIALMPDLLVVLEPGYGFGIESMRGAVPAAVLRDASRVWVPAADGGAGQEVPGVYAGTMAPKGDPSVLDIAPTVLGFFGIPIPPGAQGKNLW